MRVFLSVLTLSLLLTVPSSFAKEADVASESSGIIHMVVVWLKTPGNVEQRQQIIAGSKRLKEIPGVLDLRVGEVLPSDRPVVDSSYDVALYLRFANQADLQTYLAHPIHKTTVKEVFLPIMDRYRVYDFRDE